LVAARGPRGHIPRGCTHQPTYFSYIYLLIPPGRLYGPASPARPPNASRPREGLTPCRAHRP